ncbi:hypothetical protein CYMTET_20175 [Cymbomonas tetramitiformis]|uniref:Uncharacterized protein n=1 Tax=Cymbomonas tetramitiformis TaxID=36881 RepID=A0AAE0G522_9CHLO|nr:hypothetical protein CYMTET_20175 [Cymbomonas tetramitiformis]
MLTALCCIPVALLAGRRRRKKQEEKLQYAHADTFRVGSVVWDGLGLTSEYKHMKEAKDIVDKFWEDNLPLGVPVGPDNFRPEPFERFLLPANRGSNQGGEGSIEDDECLVGEECGEEESEVPEESESEVPEVSEVLEENEMPEVSEVPEESVAFEQQLANAFASRSSHDRPMLVEAPEVSDVGPLPTGGLSEREGRPASARASQLLKSLWTSTRPVLRMRNPSWLPSAGSPNRVSGVHNPLMALPAGMADRPSVMTTNPLCVIQEAGSAETPIGNTIAENFWTPVPPGASVLQRQTSGVLNPCSAATPSAFSHSALGDPLSCRPKRASALTTVINPLCKKNPEPSSRAARATRFVANPACMPDGGRSGLQQTDNPPQNASFFGHGLFLSQEAGAGGARDVRYSAANIANPLWSTHVTNLKKKKKASMYSGPMFQADDSIAEEDEIEASVFEGDIFLSEDVTAGPPEPVHSALQEAGAKVPLLVRRLVQALQGNPGLLAAEAGQVRSALTALTKLLGGDGTLAAQAASDTPALLTAPPWLLEALPALGQALGEMPSGGQNVEELRQVLGQIGGALLGGGGTLEAARLPNTMLALQCLLGSTKAAADVAGALQGTPGAVDITAAFMALEVALDGVEYARAAVVKCPELLVQKAGDIAGAMAALEEGLGSAESAQCAARLKPRVLVAGARAIDRAAAGLRGVFKEQAFARHALFLVACNPAVLMTTQGAVGRSAAAVVERFTDIDGLDLTSSHGERRALAAIQKLPCLLLRSPAELLLAGDALVALRGHNKAEALRALDEKPSLLLAKPHVLQVDAADALSEVLGGHDTALEFLGSHLELLRGHKGVLPRALAMLGEELGGGNVLTGVVLAQPALLTQDPGVIRDAMSALKGVLGEHARQAVQQNPELLMAAVQSKGERLQDTLEALAEVVGSLDEALHVAVEVPAMLSTPARNIRRAHTEISKIVVQETDGVEYAAELMRQHPQVLMADPGTLGGVISALLGGLATHWDADEDGQVKGSAWVLEAMMVVGREGGVEAHAITEEDLKTLGEIPPAACIAPVLEEVQERVISLQHSLSFMGREAREAAVSELGNINARVERLVGFVEAPVKGTEVSVFGAMSKQAVELLDQMRQAEERAAWQRVAGELQEEDADGAGRLRQGAPDWEPLPSELGLKEVLDLVCKKLKAVSACHEQKPKTALGRMGTLKKAIGMPVKHMPQGIPNNVSAELRNKLLHRREIAGSIIGTIKNMDTASEVSAELRNKLLRRREIAGSIIGTIKNMDATSEAPRTA